MTIEELKQKFIEKTAEMLNDVEDTENLYKLAEVYSELTKEEWTDKLLRKFEVTKDYTFGETFGGLKPCAIETTDTNDEQEKNAEN